MIVDDDNTNTAMNNYERTARLYTDIANDVIPGIVMEYEIPNNSDDKKMPILDMKVWMSEEGDILFQHYEKPTSSKNIMHARSALSVSCKSSVHTQVIQQLYTA